MDTVVKELLEESDDDKPVGSFSQIRNVSGLTKYDKNLENKYLRGAYNILLVIPEHRFAYWAPFYSGARPDRLTWPNLGESDLAHFGYRASCSKKHRKF